MTQQDALEALADFSWATLGGVDLVFANAGIGLPLRPLLDQTEAHARWGDGGKLLRGMAYLTNVWASPY